MRFYPGTLVWYFVYLVAGVLSAWAQEVDVTRIPGNPGWQVTNDAVLSVATVKGRTALLVAQGPGKVAGAGGDRLVILRDAEFTNGEIEFDVLGSAQVAQDSFVGIVFRVDLAHGRYDSVYLRPFNFRAKDPVQLAHAVQYISVPDWPWDRLRKEHPGVYERPVPAALDGDNWVHVRVVVQRPAVRVYLDHATEPSLAVTELSERSGGQVGFFAVGGQPAYFANLRIAHQP
jgi:hypothetical protein